MKIVEFFTSNNKEHWLSEIGKCDWGAGQYLHQIHRRYENGANACKAQAMFIRKYGKEKFFQVHDKLHETYSFEKTQEILGQDVQEGFKILEKYATLIR